eukprot:g29294.t1
MTGHVGQRMGLLRTVKRVRRPTEGPPGLSRQMLCGMETPKDSAVDEGLPDDAKVETTVAVTSIGLQTTSQGIQADSDLEEEVSIEETPGPPGDFQSLVKQVFRLYASGYSKGRFVFIRNPDLSRFMEDSKHILPGFRKRFRRFKRIFESLFDDTIQLQCDMPGQGLRITAGLTLDGLTRSRSAVADKGSIYVVTELCEGGNIGELDPMEDDSDEIRLLFRDVARAIAYCHSEGIAHRDLKFDNCLLAHCNDRRLGRMAKVIDFGLAGFLQAGVPGEGELEGLECDLWSFGVMLFVVLTNEQLRSERDRPTFRCTPRGTLARNGGTSACPKSLRWELRHPFCSTASGPEDAYRRIANGCLRLSCLRNAGALAIEAEDLLRSLLVKEPLNRCSAAEALVHPWLQPELETPASPSCKPEQLRSLVERISSFSRFSKFEQAILTVAAHEAKPKDELQQVFSALDLAQAGWISRDDLRRALKICDVRLSKMETDAVLDCLDADQDGKIQHTDFLAATLKPAHVKSEKVLEELFNFFDFQGTGHITHEDLKAFLSPTTPGPPTNRMRKKRKVTLAKSVLEVAPGEEEADPTDAGPEDGVSQNASGQWEVLLKQLPKGTSRKGLRSFIGDAVPSFVKLDSDAGGTSPLVSGPDPLEQVDSTAVEALV